MPINNSPAYLPVPRFFLRLSVIALSFGERVDDQHSPTISVNTINMPQPRATGCPASAIVSWFYAPHSFDHELGLDLA